MNSHAVTYALGRDGVTYTVLLRHRFVHAHCIRLLLLDSFHTAAKQFMHRGSVSAELNRHSVTKGPQEARVNHDHNPLARPASVVTTEVLYLP